MKEKDLTKAVIALAKTHGWRVAHFRTAQTKSGNWVTPVQGDGAGFPDLILLRGWRGLAIELKVGHNKPTARQQSWLNAFQEVGWDAWVLTDKDWPDRMEKILR